MRHRALPLRWSVVLSLAGTKGGLAIVMVHSLPADFVYRELFRAIVIGHVVLTIVGYSAVLIGYLSLRPERFEKDRANEDDPAQVERLAVKSSKTE